MVDWSKKQEDIASKPSAPLSGDSTSYASIRCTDCPYSKKGCPYFSDLNPGCGMRAALQRDNFAKIEFKTDDPISTNRLRLSSKYFVELMLKRQFGDPLKPDEINTLRITLMELSKLGIDSKGNLLDQKSKAAVPWELDPAVLQMKQDKEELDRLRMIVGKKKMEEKK